MLVAYYNRNNVVVACGVFVRNANTCKLPLHAVHNNFGVVPRMSVDTFFNVLHELHGIRVECLFHETVGVSLEYLG